MQWWCSAQDSAWRWEWQAYPGVWLFIALLAFVQWRWHRAAQRAGAAAPWPHPASIAGLFVLWLALDWPIGALGAGYLASVHMLQFQLIALIAVPLLLQGLRLEVLELLPRRGTFGGALVDRLTSPVSGLIAFNAIVLLTHIPAVVDSLMATQLGSFAIDLLWLAAGVLFWWPVILPVPARPRFGAPLKIGYLVLGLMFSPVMFGLAGFLVYSEHPLFSTYELAPPIAGLTSRNDHVIAGLLMSVGGAAVAFVALTKIFFDWSKREG
ncbi:MAG: cytochrome c oxidase assembly protein [Gemmatimonadaceae bacterium]